MRIFSMQSFKNRNHTRKIEGFRTYRQSNDIDQSPIGRTPRSNPASYTDVFSEIRTLFTQVPEAMIRGYKTRKIQF